MDDNRRVDDYNQDLIEKNNQLADQIHNFNQDTQGKTMDLVDKVKKVVHNEIRDKLNLMEHQIDDIDKDRNELQRKNQEMITEAHKQLRKLAEEYEGMQKDKTRVKLENSDAKIKNHQYDLYNASIDYDIKNRQLLEKKLEGALEKLKVSTHYNSSFRKKTSSRLTRNKKT